MKKCTKCKIEKEVKEYYSLPSSKDGLQHQCKCCRKQHYKDNKDNVKQYYQDNKDKILKLQKERIKERTEEKKDKYREKRRKRYELRTDKQKELIKKRGKEYWKNNKDKLSAGAKQYREKNIKNIKIKAKESREKNRENYNKYYRERRKKDFLFKLQGNLRSLTASAFRNKGYTKKTKTQNILGVDWVTVKVNIERQFTKDMNWSNYGEWHIDHIIPLASANTEEELKKLCHYSNLQPLWAFDNLIKSAKINGQQNKFRF
jgi:hypothetical protein